MVSNVDNLVEDVLCKFGDELPELVVILGPTASGKTEFAINLAKFIISELKIKCDIINADSYSIYKYMNIGTAKLSESTRNELLKKFDINHYMFDQVSPIESINVAWYCEKTRKIIEECQKNLRLPILCGGSGLYIRAITDGFDFELGQKSESERSQNKRHRGNDGSLPEYKYINPKTIQFGIELSRKILDQRIDVRTDLMRQLGLENEVKSLYSSGILGQTAIKAIGYSEFVEYFNGGVNKMNGKTLELDDVFDLIKMHTKRLVRRQESWFRRDKRIIWL